MRLTSREIREALRSGDDSKVLSYLYGNLLPKVRKYVIRNNGTKDEADDIFQDAILKLYKVILEGKSVGLENVEGFLFQISKNLWINRAKLISKENRISEIESELISEDNDAMELILSKEKQNAIMELFGMIGDKCIRIMELHLFEKKSMKEVSAILGMPGADSAKAQHYRCKQKLIQLINERHDLNRTLTK
jgi:RNA polymerase sigma factor (sigma-70 family)